MKHIIFILSICSFIYACKLETIEPRGESTGSENVNRQPKKSVTDYDDYLKASSISLYRYNPDGLLNLIIRYDSGQYRIVDSFYFFYENGRMNKKISSYPNEKFTETFSYNQNNKIDVYTKAGSNYMYTYKYHYNNYGSVAYIVSSDQMNMTCDSLVVNGNLVTNYLDKGGRKYVTPQILNPAYNGYASMYTQPYFVSSCGLYSTEEMDKVVCSNVEIDFDKKIAQHLLLFQTYTYPVLGIFETDIPYTYSSEQLNSKKSYTFDSEHRLEFFIDNYTYASRWGSDIKTSKKTTLYY
jgi:hypothetical protein